ncbi:MAG TPA: hypothetical protein VIG42_02820 [Solirubrobacteraceae bacterium]|jgi:hypothetical protein
MRSLKLTATILAAAMLATTILAGIALASSQFKQSAKVTLTAKKAGASTGFTASLQSSDPGAPLEKPQGLKTLTVTFPAKTTFNFKSKALVVCKANDTELVATGGAVCSKSKLGAGSSTANGAPILPKIEENVTAFAGSNQILLLLAPKTLGGPGATLVLHGKISANKMTTEVPPIEKAGLKIVITGLQLKIKAVGSGKTTWAKAGKCVGKKFTVKSAFLYETGEKLTISSSSSCK